MIVTFFDTETTGLLEFKAPDHDKRQPHLVQLALLMMDTVRKVPLKKVSVIVDVKIPIPAQATETHGITNEMSAKFGIQCKTAIHLFRHFAERSDRMVAHNKNFDLRLLRVQGLREGVDWNFMTGKDVYCTMEGSRNLVKSPPTEKMIAANMHGFKSPKLSECYRHFYNEELEGAHDALVDTEACARVYFTLLGLGVITEPG